LLLGDLLQRSGVVETERDIKLINAPREVFQIWRNREHIEIEATIVFDQLAKDLRELWGEQDQISALALRSSHDELRHAKRCREILSHGPDLGPALTPNYKVQFGPANLSLIQRILYTAIGVCCITETMSTALLIEMHQRANAGIIKNTIHEILVDEVDHGRIGWAIISRLSKTEDLSWIAEDLPKLIKEAFQSDITPMLGVTQDLSPWGILLEKDARPIMNKTLETVIYPGLKSFGVE
jgi:hypothetical protein